MMKNDPAIAGSLGFYEVGSSVAASDVSVGCGVAVTMIMMGVCVGAEVLVGVPVMVGVLVIVPVAAVVT